MLIVFALHLRRICGVYIMLQSCNYCCNNMAGWMRLSESHFMVVSGPRRLLQTLTYRCVPVRHVSSITGKRAACDDPQLNLVNDFRGREQDGFPCLSRIRRRNGPLEKMRGSYGEVVEGYEVLTHQHKFHFKHGGFIPRLDLAYETWGELNSQKNNTILLCTGLSASSHACSTQRNQSKGWWEKFIGPGRALDTDRYFVVCSNVLGGCYGSSGPSSINPTSGERYAMTFPVVTVEDMVRAQFLLLDYLGISCLHAAVGASLGGMQSIMSAALYPDRVGRVISISACLQTHPSSIAMRYTQRQILMGDPDWREGQYYNISFPRMGMTHAREVGTIAYRSGPEWAERFGNRRRNKSSPPDFCQDFEIEYYLDRQGEKFCESYDPNSLLYISKAMDLFDMSDGFSSLKEGVSRVKCPILVLGVTSDVLFPVQQQRDMSELLRKSGNTRTAYYELTSIYGHDTFMLDVTNVGTAVKGHLESSLSIQ